MMNISTDQSEVFQSAMLQTNLRIATTCQTITIKISVNCIYNFLGHFQLVDRFF